MGTSGARPAVHPIAQLILESAELALDHGQTSRSMATSSQGTSTGWSRCSSTTCPRVRSNCGQASATPEQATAAMALVRKPIIDAAAGDTFVGEVLSYSGAYEMKA